MLIHRNRVGEEAFGLGWVSLFWGLFFRILYGKVGANACYFEGDFVCLENHLQFKNITMPLKFFPILYTILLLCSYTPSWCQTPEFDQAESDRLWEVFSSVRMKTQFTDDGEIITKPIFTEEHTDLEGKIIQIKGYLNNTIDIGYFLTQDTFGYACLGGYAWAIKIATSTPFDNYFLRKHIIVTGTLKLNGSNPHKPYYILENPVIKWVEE